MTYICHFSFSIHCRLKPWTMGSHGSGQLYSYVSSGSENFCLCPRPCNSWCLAITLLFQRMLKFLKMWAPSSYGIQKHPSGLISLVSFCMGKDKFGLCHGLMHGYKKSFDVFYNLGILIYFRDRVLAILRMVLGFIYPLIPYALSFMLYHFYILCLCYVLSLSL